MKVSRNFLCVDTRNRGVMFQSSATGYNDLTEDGYDIQWGTNVVGMCMIFRNSGVH